MTAVWDIGPEVGQLRITLLPETDRACTRVQITTRGIAGGPLFNNAVDLVQWARDVLAACERVAPSLHPGRPPGLSPQAPSPQPPVPLEQIGLFAPTEVTTA